MYTPHGAKSRRKLIVPAGNSRPIVSERTREYVEHYNLRTALDSSLFPDIQTSDFFLFDQLKRTLQDAEFPMVEYLVDTLVQTVIDRPFHRLIACFTSELALCSNGASRMDMH
jgi:hypothetical protein